MQYTIRPYSKDDYPTIKNWWDAASIQAPSPAMLPEESTLVLELNGMPALCIAVYLTNCREIAYGEHFIGNPELKGKDRQKATEHMLNAIVSFAKALGYKRILSLTHVDKLKGYYEELGFSRALDNVSMLIKEVV